MKKVFLVLLSVVLLAGVTVNADALVKKGAGKHSGPALHDRDCDCDGACNHMSMFKDLGLDEKQKEALQAVHLKTKKEMVKKTADVKISKIELQEILSKDPVDMQAAESAVKKITGLKAEKMMMHIRAMEEIKSNLNAEQKKKLGTIIKTRHMGKQHRCNKNGMGHMECDN